MKPLKTILLCCWVGLVPDGLALAQQHEREFVVKSSEVVVPDEVEIGRFRRITQPFRNWTLVCDENLQKMEKICNVSQEIALKSGGVIFSWSLATSEIGMPLMLARLPVATGIGRPLRVLFADTKQSFEARVDECSPQFCSAVIPVGPQMKRHIQEGLTVGILFSVMGAGDIEFSAPMAGLAQALAAIK